MTGHTPLNEKQDGGSSQIRKTAKVLTIFQLKKNKIILRSHVDCHIF